MTQLKMIEYNAAYHNLWNDFVERVDNGTIFHRLDFLAYHGQKFKVNEEHLLWSRRFIF